MKNNSFYRALIGLLAFVFTLTAWGSAPPEVYTQDVAYGDTWSPPAPGPGCTQVNVDVLAFSAWYLTVENNTAFTQVNWGLSVKHVHTTGTSVNTFGSQGTSNFGGASILPGVAFVVEDNMNVGYSATYTSPADIASWTAAPFVMSSYHLEYTPTGVQVPTTVAGVNNRTQVTITYTYGSTPPPDGDDDDDKDDDGKHNGEKPPRHHKDHKGKNRD